MTIEEKLKEYILTNYKSIRRFTTENDIPYSTVDNIIKRGIANSSGTNIVKVCRALNISADALAEGRIAERQEAPERSQAVPFSKVVAWLTHELDDPSLFVLDGAPVTQEEAEIMRNSIEASFELIKKKRGKK